MAADVSSSKPELIVDALRRDILAGELPRGSRLPQDELARRFGASITPVREALRRLEAEGLVVAERNRGVRVAGVDLGQVTATYVVRRLTETYAMRRATLRLSRRDLARARALHEAGPHGAAPQEGPAPSGAAAARDRNRDFHFLFYDRCGMPALTERIAAAWQAFPWDLTLHDRSAASDAEHEAILVALEAGDPEQVAAATEAHLRAGFASVLLQLTGRAGPDPFDIHTDLEEAP